MHQPAMKPKSAHKDLIQLSKPQLVETASEGLRLIAENALALWQEANEVAQFGRRRAVGILQALAEEEAGKTLLLLDAIRCPGDEQDKRNGLLSQFNQHLAKGIYAYYYNTSPADLREVKTIVDIERKEFYREGEYGEYIMPNRLLENREARLYVSYIREDNGTHRWAIPYPPDDLWGDIVPSGAINVVEALVKLNLLAEPRLSLVADYWNGVRYLDEDPDPCVPPRNPDFRETNNQMLRTIEERGFPFSEEQWQSMETVIDGLLFPLYTFDLSKDENFERLPPPDEPGY